MVDKTNMKGESKMSKVSVNNAEIYYQTVGDGTETILFSHGYLMDNTAFTAQIDALKTQFRCIAYDHRGHGQSEVTKDGYELDNLVTDAISLIEKLDVGPVHFVGVSAGGFVGMRVALRRAELLKSLTLIDTSAEAESDQALKQYNMLLWMVKNIGWWAVMGQVLPILFHKDFLEDETRKMEVEEWKNIMTGHDRKGIVPFGKGIFTRPSVLDLLPGLSVPTAVIVGEEDASSPPEYSQRMVNAIPDAKMYTIPDAGHFAIIEKPTAVTEAMQDFYNSNGMI
jgi:pimeloyl-ACP methyl ester carboxylesterase